MMALEGIRVLDFSRLLPGPYCTQLLGDMGAEVIRVENPREVEKQKKVFGWDRLSPAEREKLRQQDITARNKQSLLLDIGAPEARAVITRIAKETDVVVEDYRPGVLAGLGLGYDDLKSVNPELVYCSVTLCGQTGPYRDKPGHDPIALAISGALSRTGEDPETPGFAGIPAADIITGTHAAFGILAALRAREKTGEGQHVDVAMSDCAMTLTANVISRNPDLSRIPPRGARRADIGIWKTADGKFLCTTDMEPRYWAAFCTVMGHEELIPLQNDIAARSRIRATFEDLFAQRTLADWLDVLEEAGTQFAPVLDIAEALENPHNLARDMVVTLPAADGTTVRQTGIPVKLSATPGAIRSTGKPPGTDTKAIYERFGISQTQPH